MSCWPGWLLPMDPAAQATCLEIAFGLNTLFSAFEDFRKSINDELKHCSATCIAFIKTMEGVPVLTQKKLIGEITAIGSKHLRWQTLLTRATRPTAFVFAYLCIVVLYNGWMATLGAGTLLLMIPVPAHAALCVLNRMQMRKEMEGKINKINKAKNLFYGRSEKADLFKIPDFEPTDTDNSLFSPPVDDPPSTPPTPLIVTGIFAHQKERRAWDRAVESFATERPLEADTIRAVSFHSAKAGIIELLLPVHLEKKLYFLRSPRNLDLLQKSLSDSLGEETKISFLIGDGNNPPRLPISG